MAKRDNIVQFCNEYLGVYGYKDYGPQGLQHIGNENVFSVATAVSVTEQVILRAHHMGAQMLLTHHGLYWQNEPHTIDVRMRKRLDALSRSRMNLCGYHLCLDAHPEIGNNILAIKALGVTNPVPFAEIGWGGTVEDGVDLFSLSRKVFDGSVNFISFSGGYTPKSVCVVTGKAGHLLPEAKRAGYELFVTGEPTEQAKAMARELEISFVAPGHYETEKSGIMALGKLVRDHFDIVHNFIPDDNPV